FSCSFQIRFQRVLLLIVAYIFIPTVYINYMQGFSMLYNEIGATIQRYRFSKGAFNLFGYTHGIEYISMSLVYDFDFFRCYTLYIVSSFSVDIFIVGYDTVVICTQ